MNLLAIECTQAVLSIAAQKENVIITRESDDWRNTAEQILPLIDATLSEAKLPATELDAIVLSAGPGSFTALRIGMSTAKGLCFALDKPLISIPTLHALGHSVLKNSTAEIILPVIHSKADEFYYAIGSRGSWRSPEFVNIENGYGTLTELLRLITDQNAPVMIAGRGISRWQEEIESSGNAAIEISDASCFNAASLIELATDKFSAHQFEDLASTEPLYLKHFEAKLSKKQPYIKKSFE
ncbi:MAG: tRNA (adenosine(37)-N6)-threonylcarbamoyltransferase complex dimerization subunit type 1 TsaB [Chlorobiales bacterium]|nr:tRNA (adenosine(37)-N6)-threonylcarbamoyltransferase complex dimerization subunit type 1 TsaB [Chlorobiales bacterium]